MEQPIDKEIVKQFSQILEKAGIENVVPTPDDEVTEMETVLINLKALNAKYDKNEAIHQIRCLMDKYNIQLDQLIDRRGIA
jgi:hypothetical protein